MGSWAESGWEQAWLPHRSVADGEIDSLYKEIDSVQQIEISSSGSTWPIVSGQVELVARIYTDNGTVSSATYSVDNTTPVAMTLTPGAKWVTATATWDTGSVSQDYHKITVTATDSAGSFQTGTDVKVSTETTLTIKDLQEHLEVYQGHYVTIQGTVGEAQFNISLAPPGSGGATINDAIVSALIYAGECYSPPLPTIAVGQKIKMKVIPMRFTWAFITSPVDREGSFGLMKWQENKVPPGQNEYVDSTKVASWFMRLVSAGDITNL